MTFLLLSVTAVIFASAYSAPAGIEEIPSHPQNANLLNLSDPPELLPPTHDNQPTPVDSLGTLAREAKLLQDFARSDTFAVCTMNYFGSDQGYSRKPRFVGNEGNYRPTKYRPTNTGNVNVGEDVYGDYNAHESNNDNDDYLQCAQQAVQSYVQNQSKEETYTWDPPSHLSNNKQGYY